MTQIGFMIPCSMIEELFREKNRLDEPVKVFSCVFDEFGDSIILLLEVDEDDFARLPTEDERENQYVLAEELLETPQ